MLKSRRTNISMQPPDNTSLSHERRKSHRVPVVRRAIVHANEPKAPIPEGRIADMSATGLQLHTAAPLFPGSVIDLEIYAGGVIGVDPPDTLRATIVRVRPGEDGGYIAGCAYAPIGDVVNQPVDRLSESPPRMRVTTAANNSIPKRHERDYRWLAALCLLLFLFAGTLLTVLSASIALPDVFGYTSDPVEERYVSSAADNPVTDVGAPAEATDPGNLDIVDFGLPEDVGGLLEAGMAAMLDAEFDIAALAFHLAVSNDSATEGEQAQADIGFAIANVALGQEGAADRAIERVLRHNKPIPPVWRDAAARLDTLIELGSRGGITQLMFAAGFTTGPPIVGALASDEFQIVVDRRGYTLSVIKAGEVVAVYPVGLGHGATTPAGNFTIANRIENPDWFNRGDVIPAGDPRNPLGGSWMGLADDRGPTPIGIHPTSEPKSIGANQSAGCIRMRPGDAEALFAVCRVGAPVTIR